MHNECLSTIVAPLSSSPFYPTQELRHSF
jgi:hypothetical protein